MDDFAPPAPGPAAPIVGTIGRPFQPGFDPRRNTAPPPPQTGRHSRARIRALAREALHKARPFAVLMKIVRSETEKTRDRIEAIKALALLGYTQSIFTGTQLAGQGALPPGDAAPDEDAVQFYLPGNGREQRDERSA